ncbi:MAG TPA: methyltransferase domain-containing protein [Rhizomicrobium sp.]|nr:methyltransferase domain-containing protein [Rhizomicrobium sp.]
MANDDQIRFWNGPAGDKWAELQTAMDRNLREVTAAILPFAAAKPGEHVLDIGCGAGETTCLLADAVGGKGRVTGLDISKPMLAVARKRGPGNTDFVEADASAQDFKPEFDLVFSRFGVMFFDDPQGAFANIRKALKPGGRLAFVCWRTPQENQWVALPVGAARTILPPQPPADPLAPGPFAFADPERIKDILSEAGYRDTRIEKLDGHMDLGQTVDEAAFLMTNIGPVTRMLMDAEADEATKAKVLAAVREALSAAMTPDGVRPVLACWMVSARA